jgi:putative ABC transport system substrate-binding protein
MAVLRNPDPTFKRMADAAVTTARAIGVALTVIEVRDPTEFVSALATVKRARIPAVLVWPNGIIYGARRQLIDQATSDGTAVASIVRQFADDGAVLSYGPNIFDQFRRAAVYVDKILKGARPADLPVEQPAGRQPQGRPCARHQRPAVTPAARRPRDRAMRALKPLFRRGRRA